MLHAFEKNSFPKNVAQALLVQCTMHLQVQADLAFCKKPDYNLLASKP